MFAIRATRNLIIFRRVSSPLPTSYYRLYSSPHDHGHHDHGHAHHNVPDEHPPNSKEYQQKYYGHLLQDGNDKHSSFFFEALNSHSFLECIAELNTSEYGVRPLTAEGIRKKYREQLYHFENVVRGTLEKEGLAKRVIDVLNEIYLVRAKIPDFEIQEAVQGVRFLGENSKFRATYGEFPDHPQWKLLNPFAWTHWGAVAKNNPSQGNINNQTRCEHNVRRLRGFIGLAKAVQRGFTNEEKDKLFRLLGPPSEEDKKKISEAIQQIIAAVKVNRKKGLAAFEEALESLPNIPGHKDYFFTEIRKLRSSGKAIQKSSKEHHVEEKQSDKELFSPENKRIGKVTFEEMGVNHPLAATQSDLDKLFEKCGKPDSLKTLYEKTKAFLNKPPEYRKEFEFIHLFLNADLSADQLLDLADSFADHTYSDDLLNDVMNPHPISARLLGDRVAYMATDKINYTKRYEEGDWSNYRDADHFSPQEREQFEKKIWNTDLLDSPTPMHPPFNTALEEIIHHKLIRLAEDYFDWDLNTDIGVATMDKLLHDYDVSPGEETLDRCHPNPPNFHTYDELPIIKFDGYAEDFSTFQLEKEKKRNVEH